MKHLLIDLYDAHHLDHLETVETVLRAAVRASGATLLHLHVHPFGDGQGVSGVAVLAESHISIHTWPERGYVAADAFMCGDAEPELAAEALRRGLEAGRIEVREVIRG